MTRNRTAGWPGRPGPPAGPSPTCSGKLDRLLNTPLSEEEDLARFQAAADAAFGIAPYLEDGVTLRAPSFATSTATGRRHRGAVAVTPRTAIRPVSGPSADVVLDSDVLIDYLRGLRPVASSTGSRVSQPARR